MFRHVVSPFSLRKSKEWEEQSSTLVHLFFPVSERRLTLK